MFKIFKFIKDLLLFIPILLIFQPINKIFNKMYYFAKLSSWIRKNKAQLELNDFYRPVRDDYSRPVMYKFFSDKFDLVNNEMCYIEFGVFEGHAFKWWLNNNKNADSHFFGFDTFEGLPEKWGFYKAGDMHANIPQVDDERAHFIKGLFQDTLNKFIDDNREILNKERTCVYHFDADLYSSTLFSLTQIYPLLKKGDIIIFDEFNVPLHEFKAYLEFTSSFNIKMKPVAALNNFYQMGFVVE